MACRRQKVKCDETLPACLRCVAGQRECDYVTGNSKGKERCRRSTSTRQRSEESPKLFTVRTSPGPLDNSVTLGDGSMTEKKDNLYEPQSSWDLSDFLNLPSTTVSLLLSLLTLRTAQILASSMTSSQSHQPQFSRLSKPRLHKSYPRISSQLILLPLQCPNSLIWVNRSSQSDAAVVRAQSCRIHTCRCLHLSRCIQGWR